MTNIIIEPIIAYSDPRVSYSDLPYGDPMVTYIYPIQLLLLTYTHLTWSIISLICG